MFIKQDKEIWYSETHRFGKCFKRKRTRKVYYFECDYCNDSFMRTSGNFSPKRIDGDKYHHVCDNCKNRRGEFGWVTKDKNSKKKIGQKIIDSLGYVNVYVGKDYPYSKPYCCSIREHIKVMEEHLGRPLKRSKRSGRRRGRAEVVHHIDGDKANNDLSNLDLCTVQQHNKCHAVLEGIVLELYKQGQVGYDRKTKRYFLKAA